MSVEKVHATFHIAFMNINTYEKLLYTARKRSTNKGNINNDKVYIYATNTPDKRSWMG